MYIYAFNHWSSFNFISTRHRYDVELSVLNRSWYSRGTTLQIWVKIRIWPVHKPINTRQNSRLSENWHIGTTWNRYVKLFQNYRIKDQIKLKRLKKRPQLKPLAEAEMNMPFSHHWERERDFECCWSGPENKRLARKPGIISHRPELSLIPQDRKI